MTLSKIQNATGSKKDWSKMALNKKLKVLDKLIALQKSGNIS